MIRARAHAVPLAVSLLLLVSACGEGDAASPGQDAGTRDAGASDAGTLDARTPEGPVIRDVSATEITETGATITWTLSEPATGQVDYGTTTAYGLTSAPETSFDYSAHAQVLSGLTPGTRVHFRVRSSNRAGAESLSPDHDFTTLAGADRVYPPDGPWVAATSTPLPRPDHLVPVTDPDFGTEILRISEGQVHDYAKTQPWNSDQTLIRLNRWILDARTYEVLLELPDMPNEVKWASTDPHRMFGERGNQLVSIDAITGEVTPLRTFAEYTNVYLGPWEGNVSTDDATVVLVTEADNLLLPAADVIVYDIAGDRVVATRSLASMGYGAGGGSPDLPEGWGIDWASISQSGRYVVINGGYSADGSVKSYDRELNLVATLFPVGGHGDVGVDASGNEVYVQVGPFRMSRLDSGEVTDLMVAGGYGGHVSCRNVSRPGWAYLSVWVDVDPATNGELFAIRLDGSGIVERFTHHHSSQATYEQTAFGVGSPDGTMMMYRSDWYGSATTDAYVVGMPQP